MVAFLKRLASRYGEDEISGRAAALSYFAIFSIGPLLFLIFGVIGLVVKHSGARAHLLSNLNGVIGPDATHAISGTLSNQGLGSKTSLAFWVGIVGLVLAAIGIFGQLQQSINAILHVKAGPGAGKKPLVRQKMVSLVLVGVMCLLLLASVAASTFLSSLGGHHGAEHFLFFIVDILSSLIILCLMLALLYRFLPPVKIDWNILLKTSLIVSALFTIGKLILGIIIGRNGTISAYGAAGSLIALLLWIFYSGQILYLGAAGLGVYLDDHPQAMSPRYGAEKGVVKIEKRQVSLVKKWYERLFDSFLGGLREGWSDKN